MITWSRKRGALGLHRPPSRIVLFNERVGTDRSAESRRAGGVGRTTFPSSECGGAKEDVGARGPAEFAGACAERAWSGLFDVTQSALGRCAPGTKTMRRRCRAKDGFDEGFAGEQAKPRCVMRRAGGRSALHVRENIRFPSCPSNSIRQAKPNALTRGYLACLLALALPACAARQRGIANETAQGGRSEGRTTVRQLASVDGPSVGGRTVAIVAAEAGPENKLPQYPPAALLAGCGTGIIVVRIHIGTNGRVIRQSELTDGTPAPDPCHDRFVEAVRATVADWGFFPALRRACAEDGSGCVDTPLVIYVDLEFRFDVVSGSAGVASP